MKTEDVIVASLADSDEPYYIVKDECYCSLCPTKGDPENDRIQLPPGHRAAYEDGMSIMGHVKACEWRQAIEYVAAKQPLK